nr:hypothetical protein [Enterococcus innesii]
MKITAVETKRIPIQLNAPFKTALREVHAVEVIRVLLFLIMGSLVSEKQHLPK